MTLTPARDLCFMSSELPCSSHHSSIKSESIKNNPKTWTVAYFPFFLNRGTFVVKNTKPWFIISVGRERYDFWLNQNNVSQPEQQKKTYNKTLTFQKTWTAKCFILMEYEKHWRCPYSTFIHWSILYMTSIACLSILENYYYSCSSWGFFYFIFFGGSHIKLALS